MEKPYRPKFLDKEIIEQRREKLKQQYTSLEKGVYMGGKIREFERQGVLNLVSMRLPTDFIIMLEEYAQIKYTSSFRPQHIITTPNLNVNMGFSLFPNHLKDKDAQRVSLYTKDVLSSEELGLDFGMCTKVENIDGYWFDFRNHAMDQDMYNIFLVTFIKQKMLQVTFNCLIQEQLDWKPVVLQMFETIEPIKEEYR
ncbi:MAG: hypothetical protein FWG67_05725 [Defluviitaleaceae bacterium]|nr:hypothetical protein [Defluviitaleaceae bacterium]